MRPPSQTSLEYLRRLYGNILDWYKIADARAQLILTLDGAFITIVTATVFANPEELAARQQVFGLETWIFLSLSALAIVGSIISAIVCLYFQGLNATALRHMLADRQVNVDNMDSYQPAVAWWYGMIAILQPDQMIQYLKTADEKFEIDALADQVVVSSRAILMKDRSVNRGWLLAGISLVFLVAAGASYVLRA